MNSPLLLLLAASLVGAAAGADGVITGHSLVGTWTPTLPADPVVKSIEAPDSLYTSRVTPPEHESTRQPGYHVTVEIEFDESGSPAASRIHQSDDLTPGSMLNQVALQLAAKVQQPPRLRDGRPIRFTARVPFFFPVEHDEGPEANATARPAVVRSQPPLFPDLLIARGESGGAILELTISARGAVTKAKVLAASHEVCGDAAVAAVKNWVFTPAQRDGSPVKSRWRIAVAFDLGGHPGDLKWRLPPRPCLGVYSVGSQVPAP
jgi:TonB family protein